MTKLLHKEITDLILKAYYEVYNELGHGFLEKVYQNAMFFELQNKLLKVEAQKKIIVFYKNKIVGEFFSDNYVNDSVIVEIKATSYLIEENEFQLMNYLRATDVEVGLLLNFGKTAEFKRIVYTNEFKDRKKKSF